MSFPLGGIQATLQEHYQDNGLCWLLQMSPLGEVAGKLGQQSVKAWKHLTWWDSAQMQLLDPISSQMQIRAASFLTRVQSAGSSVLLILGHTGAVCCLCS